MKHNSGGVEVQFVLCRHLSSAVVEKMFEDGTREVRNKSKSAAPAAQRVFWITPISPTDTPRLSSSAVPVQPWVTQDQDVHTVCQ